MRGYTDDETGLILSEKVLLDMQKEIWPAKVLTKYEYGFLDKVGVGQISIHELSFNDRDWLKHLINKAVSIIPLDRVEGM